MRTGDSRGPASASLLPKCLQARNRPVTARQHDCRAADGQLCPGRTKAAEPGPLGRGSSIRVAATLANCPTTILALWCVMYPTAAIIAASPDTGVTSDADPSPPAATLQEGVGGRVTSAFGAPIANVFVQARSISGPRAVPDIAVYTDSAGHYSWKLDPGVYELTFMQDGRELVRKRVVVRPNELTRLDIKSPGQPTRNSR
jgi:hypothetical protein